MKDLAGEKVIVDESSRLIKKGQNKYIRNNDVA